MQCPYCWWDLDPAPGGEEGRGAVLHALLHLFPPPEQHRWDPQVPAPLCVSRAGLLRRGAGVRCPPNRSAHSFNIVIWENGE